MIIRIETLRNISVAAAIKFGNIRGDCDVTLTAHIPSNIIDYYHDIFSTSFKYKNRAPLHSLHAILLTIHRI